MINKLKTRFNQWMHPKEKYSSDELYKALFNSTDISAVENIQASSGLNIIKRPVQVAVVKIFDGSCNPDKIKFIMESCTKTSDSDEVVPVSNSCDQVVLIFFSDVVWQDQALQILEDLKKDFYAAWPDTRFYITLGPVENYTAEGEPVWKKSYRAALGLLDYRFIKPSGKIIVYSDIVSRRNIYPQGVNFRFDLLKEYLEVNSWELISNWLSNAYNILNTEKKEFLGLRYHLTLEIVVNTLALVREKGVDPESLIGTPEALISQVLEIESLEDMKSWTEAFLKKCYNIVN